MSVSRPDAADCKSARVVVNERAAERDRSALTRDATWDAIKSAHESNQGLTLDPGSARALANELQLIKNELIHLPERLRMHVLNVEVRLNPAQLAALMLISHFRGIFSDD